MRSLIRVIALASSIGCSSESVECPAILGQPVLVSVLNGETGRRISGATVTVSGDASFVELMELSRGQYGLWSEVPGTTITATHADYFEAMGTLVTNSSVCSPQQTATLWMERKLPCDRGVAGVRADVRDELDGTPVVGATLQLLDGIYSEQMQEMAPGLYEGAYDRPGIYRVEASAPGHETALAQRVWAEEDDCSVLTASVALTLPRADR